MAKRARPDDAPLLPNKKRGNLQGMSRDELLAAPINSIEQFGAFPSLSILAERAAWAHVMGVEEIQQLVLPWLNAHDELVLATTCRLLRRFYYHYREDKVVLAFRREVEALDMMTRHYGKGPKAITHAILNALHGTFTGNYRSQGFEAIAADFIGGQFKYTHASGIVFEDANSVWVARGIYEPFFMQAPASAIKKGLMLNKHLRLFNEAEREQCYIKLECKILAAALSGIMRRDRVEILEQFNVVALFEHIPSAGEKDLLNVAIYFGARRILRYLFGDPERRKQIGDVHYNYLAFANHIEIDGGNKGDYLTLYLTSSGIDLIIKFDAIDILLLFESILGQDVLKTIIIANTCKDPDGREAWMTSAARQGARRCSAYFQQAMASPIIHLPKKVYFKSMEYIARTSDWEWFASFYDSKYRDGEQLPLERVLREMAIVAIEPSKISWILQALHYKVSVDFLEKMLELIDNAWLQAAFQHSAPSHHIFLRSLITNLYRSSATSYNDYFDAVCELLGKRYLAIRDILSDKNACCQLSTLLLRDIFEQNAIDRNASLISALLLAAHIIDRCDATTDYNEGLVELVFGTQLRLLDFNLPIFASSSSMKIDPVLSVFDAFRNFIRYQLMHSTFSSIHNIVPRVVLLGRVLIKRGFDKWCTREGIKVPTAFLE